MNQDIFISYSRVDSGIANLITNILDSNGYNYFIDRRGIASGDEFAKTIIQAIDNCKVFVLLHSKDSSESMWVRKEVEYAAHINKEILLIGVDDSPLSHALLFRFGPKNILNIRNTHFKEIFLKSIGQTLGDRQYENLSEEEEKANLKIADERRNGTSEYVPKKIDVDIFISYRRVDGRNYARNIMQALKIVGYPKVFFDYNSLRDGVFNTQILDAIYSCKDFILVISPLALKNCSREGDWVSKEIRTALQYKKKIIPVVIEDTFTGWPADFPSDLSSIKNIQFHKLMTDEYFEDSIEKLSKRLETPVSTDTKDLIGFRDLQTSESTQKETIIYKIKVNRKCRLLIDDEEIQVIEASHLTKIPLPVGEYIRKVIAIDDDAIYDEAAIILEHDKAEIISLQKKLSFWKRIFG